MLFASVGCLIGYHKLAYLLIIFLWNANIVIHNPYYRNLSEKESVGESKQCFLNFCLMACLIIVAGTPSNVEMQEIEKEEEEMRTQIEKQRKID
jgi:hypothetical protein